MPATKIAGIGTTVPMGPSQAFTAITIPDGAATPADGFDLGGASLVGIITPASFEGATITFTVSHDDTTYVAMYDFTGVIVGITSGSSRYIPLDPALFVGVRYLKPVTASNQTGAAIVQFVTRPIL